MVRVQDFDFPDHLHYDMNNQVWYAPLGDGTVRAGFTSWSASLMGDIIVFTPKRLGFDFEKERSFAVVEGGKWVGSARAAFDGVMVAANPLLERWPELIGSDSYGDGWMVIVRPLREDWAAALVTGDAVGPAFEAWLDTGAYRDRA